MYTVIICDKKIIDDCKIKYKMHFNQFIENEELSFCEWNIDGLTLEEAVPDLEYFIKNKKKWRAVIVYDQSVCGIDRKNSVNPFDYSGYESFKEISTSEQAIKYRDYIKRVTEKSLENPLQRLSIWLSGISINRSTVAYEEVLSSLQPDSSKYAEILKVTNSTIEDTEIKLARIYKYDQLSSKYDLSGALFNPPSSVIAIAERTQNEYSQITKNLWNNPTEFDSSKFYIDNLYSEKLRYLVFDIFTKNQVRFENAYFAFLLTILVFSVNDAPEGSIKANRVYRLSINMDYERINEVCKLYNTRLKSTLLMIDKAKTHFDRVINTPISNKVASEFSEEFEIPIDINSEYDTSRLYAKYDGIGLSRDCPREEYNYWEDQYTGITKLFAKYIREPRRAVKTAVKGTFRNKNKVRNDKLLQMNSYQQEDIGDALLVQEELMVKTSTAHIFKTSEYKKQMDEADMLVKKSIDKRMTRRRTIVVFAVALVAFMIGFLPMIITSFSKLGNLTFSAIVTGVSVFLLAICGIVFLFILRHRLINVFKHFNYVMGGIISDIESSLEKFSNYLTHACCVMRNFSIIDYINKGIDEKNKIFNYHKTNISRIIANNHILFSSVTNKPIEPNICCEELAYNYDFSELCNYDYPVPYAEVPKKIEFLQKGNLVDVYVDYINSVTLTREELYD